jgi:hypothetical protein
LLEIAREKFLLKRRFRNTFTYFVIPDLIRDPAFSAGFPLEFTPCCDTGRE